MDPFDYLTKQNIRWIKEAFRFFNGKARPLDLLNKVNEMHHNEGGMSRKTLYKYLKKEVFPGMQKERINKRHVIYILPQKQISLEYEIKPNKLMHIHSWLETNSDDKLTNINKRIKNRFSIDRLKKLSTTKKTKLITTALDKQFHNYVVWILLYEINKHNDSLLLPNSLKGRPDLLQRVISPPHFLKRKKEDNQKLLDKIVKACLKAEPSLTQTRLEMIFERYYETYPPR